MKPYFQGMITGGSLMITFFVLTASQIPIAEDSGTFNTLNVETINVSKSINFNDKIIMYQKEENEEYGMVFNDENGNSQIQIAYNKEIHGLLLRDGEEIKLGINVFKENPIIQFFDNGEVKHSINKDKIEIGNNANHDVVYLGRDINNNGMLQLFNSKPSYNTVSLGNDLNSNGMIYINNNNEKQTFYLGHTTNDDGIFQIKDRNGNPTHESP